MGVELPVPFEEALPSFCTLYVMGVIAIILFWSKYGCGHIHAAGAVYLLKCLNENHGCRHTHNAGCACFKAMYSGG